MTRRVLRLLLLFLGRRGPYAYALCVHEGEAQRAVLSLCSSERWIETAYASYPCWKTFIDVGANKGYTAALFFGLWHRAGGLRGTRHWWRAHVQAGIWPARVRKGFCGACLDCLGDAKRANTTRTCDHEATVHSFDGTQTFIKSNIAFAHRIFPEVARRWRVNWMAVSEHNGTAYFEQPFAAWFTKRVLCVSHMTVLLSSQARQPKIRSQPHCRRRPRNLSRSVSNEPYGRTCCLHRLLRPKSRTSCR
jgi:hypothetical protein